MKLPSKERGLTQEILPWPTEDQLIQKTHHQVDVGMREGWVIRRCQRSFELWSAHKAAKLAEVVGLWEARVSAFSKCFT